MQATTKAVFKGLQDLLKYLLQFVEEELQKDSEASILSVFLIFRLAFSIHLPPSKKTGGGLAFLSALFGMDDTQDKSTKPTQQESVEMESVLGSSGKFQEECDGGNGKSEPERKQDGGQEPAEVRHGASAEEKSPLKDDSRGLEDGRKEEPSQDDGDNSQRSLVFEDPLSSMAHYYRDGSPVHTIGSTSSAFSPPVEVESRLPRTHPIATPPSSEKLKPPNLSNGGHPTGPGVRSASLSPVRVNQHRAKGSPLLSKRAVSPSHQLLLELLESPRVYHPNETGHRLTDCVLLYKELVKSLGSSRSFLMEKKFWNVLFMSTICTDRNQLGWNEKTAELYTR